MAGLEAAFATDFALGGKDRNVPLTRSAAEAIEACLEGRRPHIRGATKIPRLLLARRGGEMHDRDLRAHSNLKP